MMQLIQSVDIQAKRFLPNTSGKVTLANAVKGICNRWGRTSSKVKSLQLATLNELEDCIGCTGTDLTIALSPLISLESWYQ
jgi:hypothetical protein